MRRYLTPFVWIGIAIVLVAIVSWFAIPGWQTMPGGLLLLVVAAAVGVLTIVQQVVSIAKDAKELQKPEPPSQAPAPVTSGAKHSIHQEGGVNIVADHIKADQIGGTRTQTPSTARSRRKARK